MEWSFWGVNQITNFLWWAAFCRTTFGCSLYLQETRMQKHKIIKWTTENGRQAKFCLHAFGSGGEGDRLVTSESCVLGDTGRNKHGNFSNLRRILFQQEGEHRKCEMPAIKRKMSLRRFSKDKEVANFVFCFMFESENEHLLLLSGELRKKNCSLLFTRRQWQCSLQCDGAVQGFVARVILIQRQAIRCNQAIRNVQIGGRRITSQGKNCSKDKTLENYQL